MFVDHDADAREELPRLKIKWGASLLGTLVNSCTRRGLRALLPLAADPSVVAESRAPDLLPIPKHDLTDAIAFGLKGTTTLLSANRVPQALVELRDDVPQPLGNNQRIDNVAVYTMHAAPATQLLEAQRCRSSQSQRPGAQTRTPCRRHGLLAHRAATAGVL